MVSVALERPGRWRVPEAACLAIFPHYAVPDGHYMRKRRAEDRLKLKATYKQLNAMTAQLIEGQLVFLVQDIDCGFWDLKPVQTLCVD